MLVVFSLSAASFKTAGASLAGSKAALGAAHSAAGGITQTVHVDVQHVTHSAADPTETLTAKVGQHVGNTTTLQNHPEPHLTDEEWYRLHGPHYPSGHWQSPNEAAAAKATASKIVMNGTMLAGAGGGFGGGGSAPRPS